MLDAEVERECVLTGTWSCTFDRPGEGFSELDREYDAFETGDIIGAHSTGSVALLYMTGLACLALWMMDDEVRRWIDGRWADEGSREESWVLIFGSKVGPC
jgi:hypothetical protein